jgi:hypothetical protein
MKRLILAALLAVLAAPVLAADEQSGMDRELTTVSDVWSNDHNFVAPAQ